MVLAYVAAAVGISSIEELIKRSIRIGLTTVAATVTSKRMAHVNFDWFTNQIGVDLRDRKDPEIERARRFINTVKNINLEQNIVSNVVAAFDPQLGRMVRDIYGSYIWSLGLGWLSWVALSPFLTTVLSRPLEKVFRKDYRPTDLSRSLIEKAYKQGLIDEKEFEERLAVLGYPDRDIKILKAMIQLDLIEDSRSLTKSEILRAFRLGLIDENTALSFLLMLGYLENAAKLLIAMEKAKKEIDFKEDLVNIFKKEFKEDLISEDEFRNRLVALGYSLEDIEKIVKLAAAEKEYSKLKEAAKHV